MPSSDKKSLLQDFDLIHRGEKRSTPLGTFIFVFFRGIDPVLQYWILAHGLGAHLLQNVGLSPIPDGAPLQTGITFIDNLGLSPYRFILLCMATGSSAKHIIWLLFLSQEAFPVKSSLIIVLINTLFNSTNDLMGTSTLSPSLTGSFPQTPVIVGGLLFLTGVLTETVAEVQRKKFKDDPKNKGKVYTGGFFSIVRHINYTGYCAWRSGYSMTGGGLTAGLMSLSFWVVDFNLRGIPALDQYCSKRYGKQWEEYKKKTPSKIIPGIW